MKAEFFAVSIFYTGCYVIFTRHIAGLLRG